MKILTLALVFSVVATFSIRAAGADEKAFTDGYKAAFEGKDAAKLASYLYTTGSDPQAVEFYKMMQSAEAGSKISKIELSALTPEEAKKAGGSMPSPDGKTMCLPLKPTKKLIVEVASDSGKSTSTNFV